jgi:penicillin amidase
VLSIAGVIIGHNQNISWSVTNVGADVQDLYVMDQVNSTHYRYKESVFEYTLRTEVIRVKHADDVTIVVREARQYGPIISDLQFDLIHDADLASHAPMALRWISIDPTVADTTFDAFLELNTASGWPEFRSALSKYIAPSQNMMYADRFGGIGYQMTGVVPVREGGGSGLAPVPGTGQFDWKTALVAFEDMPAARDPAQHFFASANNAAVPDDYKVYITGDWDAGSDGYRARRITQVRASSMQASRRMLRSHAHDD